MQHYVRPDGLPPVNGYSHAVSFTGRMVAISGQVPLDGQGKLAGNEPQAQVRQVFENLAAALAAAGAGLEHVVKLTVYLTDLADLGAFRLVRDEYIALDNPPASTLVQVSGQPARSRAAARQGQVRPAGCPCGGRRGAGRAGHRGA
jgi:enamine deaminase RidA (YjgF/YER057c/UK114 family)